VGITAGDDDAGVVEESVEEADGGGVLGQEAAPLVEGPVAGDAERAAFAGGGDEPEQQLGAGVVERREPDFVDQEQVVAASSSAWHMSRWGTVLLAGFLIQRGRLGLAFAAMLWRSISTPDDSIAA
jgi:hypothetical protein